MDLKFTLAVKVRGGHDSNYILQPFPLINAAHTPLVRVYDSVHGPLYIYVYEPVYDTVYDTVYKPVSND